MALLECARRHTEDMLGTTVEIGEHAIAIEEELHQPNLAGMIRIGTGASSGRQPRAAITSLLWTALRPRLRSSRSEERRVGKEWSGRLELGGRRIIKKKREIT